MRLQDDIHMHPYTHIAAIMLVTIKLLYCLDAEGSEDNDAEAQAGIDWQAWAQAVVKASRGPVSFPTAAAAVHSQSMHFCSTFNITSIRHLQDSHLRFTQQSIIG